MSFAVTKSLDAAATNTTGAAASTDSSTLSGVPVTGVLVHVFGDGATTSSTTIEQSLDSAAIGDSVTLKAWQGIAYITATTGTITLA